MFSQKNNFPYIALNLRRKVNEITELQVIKKSFKTVIYYLKLQ